MIKHYSIRLQGGQPHVRPQDRLSAAKLSRTNYLIGRILPLYALGVML